MDKIDIIKMDSDCRIEAARYLGEPVQAKSKYSVWSCPFHAEKTVGAFHVWRDGYHCFSCGAFGDVFDLWQFFTEKSLKELLTDRAGNLSSGEINKRKQMAREKVATARAAVDAERARQLKKLHESEKHLFYAEVLDKSLVGQAHWQARGIDEVWQKFFGLGYAENFSFTGKYGRETSNSLVIPVKKLGGEVVTIRHRLLNARDGSRYRPEVAGLGAHPFICDTELSKKVPLIIVEGEIKAMVTYITNDKVGVQVVGIPSKSMMIKTIKSVGSREAIVIPDPDGVKDIFSIAKSVGVGVVVAPQKIDDWILGSRITTREFRQIVRQARVI